MSQLVRLEGKHSTQNAHCAVVVTTMVVVGMVVVVVMVGWFW